MAGPTRILVGSQRRGRWCATQVDDRVSAAVEVRLVCVGGAVVAPMNAVEQVAEPVGLTAGDVGSRHEAGVVWRMFDARANWGRPRGGYRDGPSRGGRCSYRWMGSRDSNPVSSMTSRTAADGPLSCRRPPRALTAAWAASRE